MSHLKGPFLFNHREQVLGSVRPRPWGPVEDQTSRERLSSLPGCALQRKSRAVTAAAGSDPPVARLLQTIPRVPAADTYLRPGRNAASRSHGATPRHRSPPPAAPRVQGRPPPGPPPPPPSGPAPRPEPPLPTYKTLGSTMAGAGSDRSPAAGRAGPDYARGAEARNDDARAAGPGQGGRRIRAEVGVAQGGLGTQGPGALEEGSRKAGLSELTTSVARQGGSCLRSQHSQA